MDPMKIINKYYDKDSKAYHYLVVHSKNVTKKALQVARKVKHFNPDLKFIKEAAMLHDIGMIKTNVLGCKGTKEYICHGVLGKEMLEKEGLPKHALVAERHLCITKEEVIERKLPLPKKDMVPVTVEEEIIAFADLFYSKVPEYLHNEKSIEHLREILPKYRKHKLEIFERFLKLYG